MLNARYVFNTLEKLLFAKGTLPVLLGDHAYAERQDDITYVEWHRKRGMTEHMLRTFFAPMSLALNFTTRRRDLGRSDAARDGVLRVEQERQPGGLP